jgi:hypothetical protein
VTLFLAGILVFLGLLVLKASVVADLADGRLRVGRNLDQVEPGRPCARERVFRLQNPKLMPVFVDYPNGTNSNLIVDAQKFCYVLTSK